MFLRCRRIRSVGVLEQVRVPGSSHEQWLPDGPVACHDPVGRAPTECALDQGRTIVMKFALHFGNNTFSDPEGARRLVRLAEATGFDSVFAVEHVVWPENYERIYPYGSTGRLPGNPSTKLPDPLISLT